MYSLASTLHTLTQSAGPVLTVLLAQADNVLLLAADADVFRAAFGEGVPVVCASFVFVYLGY